MSQAVFRPFFVLILLFGQTNSAQADPPPNDNFANAETITSLPFVTGADASAATVEPGENPSCGNSDRTIWYSFTSTESTVLYVDDAGSETGNVIIYRSNGAGIENLQYVMFQCAGWSTETFPVEAGQTYYIQVSPLPGEAGTVQFRLGRTTPLRGRVIDAATGEPLPGDSDLMTQVLLYRVCGPGCTDWVATRLPDSDGRFQFDIFPGVDLQPAIYIIEVYARLYHDEQFGPFVWDGTPQNIGDLLLDHFASIRSIRGHVLDRATGKPIRPAFAPVVKLERCFEGSCYEEVNTQPLDSQGRFRFETDASGEPLTIGTYRITVTAGQYQEGQTELFEVSPGADYSIGTLRIRSFPVRFSDIVPCADLPASGGECEVSIRIWNGMTSDLKGKVWNIMDANLSNAPFFGSTGFQIRASRAMEVRRGRSKVIHFRFQVPADPGPYDSNLCIVIYVGRGDSVFNTLGSDYFCFVRSGNGLTLLSADENPAYALAAQAIRAAEKDNEPNNSCQAAQDAGAISSPISIDGVLDSALEPDIDFYRFHSMAGEPLAVELEGQASEAGILGQPALGAFNSDCGLIDYNASYFTSTARLVLQAPENGVFILALTDVSDVDFVGGGNGGYRLAITPLPSLITISGTVIDARTGAPLPGGQPSFAYVYLLRCNETNCNDMANTAIVGSDGRFHFDSDFEGLPLSAGKYVVSAGARQYQYGESEPFTVGDGEQVDIGDVPLTPWTVQISDEQGCDIPTEGGICEFSVKVTNTSPKRFSGKAWNLTYGSGIGSFLNHTAFGAGRPVNLRLGPGETRTVRFRFRIPGRVSNGASICPRVYIGQKPDAYFNLVGQMYLFCMTKGPAGLTLMPPKDAQAAIEKIQEWKLTVTSRR